MKLNKLSESYNKLRTASLMFSGSKNFKLFAPLNLKSITKLSRFSRIRFSTSLNLTHRSKTSITIESYTYNLTSDSLNYEEH